MADDKSNNQGDVQESGDVLGSISDSSASNRKILKSINDSVHDVASDTAALKREVLKFISSNSVSNAQNFSASVDDAVRGKRSSQFARRENKDSHSFTSSASARAASDGNSAYKAAASASSRLKIDPMKHLPKEAEGAVKQAFDGFEEELCKYLGIPYVGDDIGDKMRKHLDGWAKNLSDALNVPVEDLSKTIAKEVTKSYLDSNPKWAAATKKITNWYKSGFESAREQAKKAWDDSISKMDTESYRDSFKWDNLFKIDKSDNSDKSGIGKRTGVGKDASVTNGSLYDAVDYWFDTYDSTIGFKSSDAISKRYEDIEESILASINDIRNGSSSSINIKDIISNAGVDNKFASDYLEKIVDKIGLGDAVRTANNISDANKQYTGSSILSDLKDSAFDAAKDKLKEGAAGALKTGDVASIISGLKGATSALKVAAPQMLVAAAAMAGLDAVSEEFTKLFNRFSSGLTKMMNTNNRWDESRQKAIEAQEERFAKDVETLIRTPFQILEDAANKVYEVWDSALQTINGTQGYDKAGLQDLMTAYASRLRSEGLSDVVGTTDVTSMLESILNQGLSGKVAEEFAYQATILHKAIPTEDFTSYAQSYASLASSYISAGHTQAEALEYANSQLHLFASNILNASREVSGGFTSSLTGVSGLFEDIVKIAETGGSSDISGLSSALSVVQAVAGQVSSDVGTSLVSQIVNAAIGGNDSNLVALRSLAGTGASNTAFLQALVKNPNSVLANMFSGLESLFDKSTDNYMEVAYSLSDTFGVSADALTRIDWNKLVTELQNNTSSNASLEQNMQLLASGETTTSAESQRLAQINQYMIDQGLSYVLDNEAARQIQQHMWDQELAAQMQESTYAVDFAGGALEMIQSVVSFLGNIIKILTFGASAPATLANTASDYVGLKEDLANLIKAGQVGNGNSEMYKRLTTYDFDVLDPGKMVEKNLMQYWGKSSSYYRTSAATDNIASSLDSIQSASMPSSKYSWASAGKSALESIAAYHPSSYTLSGVSSLETTSSLTSNQASKASEWLDSMTDYIANGKSYQEWYDSAQDYGLSDIDTALSDLGYSSEDMQNMYMDASTDYAVQQAADARALQNQFYSDGVNWYESTYPSDYENWNLKYDANVENWITVFTDNMTVWRTLYTDTMTSFTEHLDGNFKAWTDLYTAYTDDTHKYQQRQINQFDESFINDFLYEWKDYYIGNHTHYRDATSFDSAIHTINSEKSQTGEAVLALAQSLTKEYQDLADPQVQTNVLLGQIVILLQSILTAQTSGSGLTLPTALSALGLNINSSGK